VQIAGDVAPGAQGRTRFFTARTAGIDLYGHAKALSVARGRVQNPEIGDVLVQVQRKSHAGRDAHITASADRVPSLNLTPAV
jgi:hypothetical protein